MLRAARSAPSAFIAELERSAEMNSNQITLSEIVGPWKDSGFESGLITRCKDAWSKPLDSLTNLELATYLRQNVATEHLIPLAKKRITNRNDDDSEFYDGQLAEALDYAENH